MLNRYHFSHANQLWVVNWQNSVILPFQASSSSASVHIRRTSTQRRIVPFWNGNTWLMNLRIPNDYESKQPASGGKARVVNVNVSGWFFYPHTTFGQPPRLTGKTLKFSKKIRYQYTWRVRKSGETDHNNATQQQGRHWPNNEGQIGRRKKVMRCVTRSSIFLYLFHNALSRGSNITQF